MVKARTPIVLLGAICALSACSNPVENDDLDEIRDPLIEQALGDHLMVDPDLASQNEANAALTVGYDSSIPPPLTGPEQRAKAQAASRTLLLDGGKIVDLPMPNKDEDWPQLAGAFTAAERAARIEFAESCAERLNYSAVWAARLPDYAIIVPHGAIVEAAGNPDRPCNIRSVTYLTDLPVEDVMQFHYNLAARAGLAPLYSEGKENAVHGTSGEGSLAVHARPRGGFQTEVDIVTRQY